MEIRIFSTSCQLASNHMHSMDDDGEVSNSKLYLTSTVSKKYPDMSP